jgi:ABC-type lipoprotein export system ATPase subunit
MGRSGTPTIQLEYVSKILGQGSQAICAIDAVSLEVRAGEFLAITGANGSGKSTLLHLIAGLETPTSGIISVAGARLAIIIEKKKINKKK